MLAMRRTRVGGVEEIVPVCLQEMCKDSTQQFSCVGLLTEQEARRDLGVEGTLVQLDIGFRNGEVNQSGKHGREIKPCKLPSRQTEEYT